HVRPRSTTRHFPTCRPSTPTPPTHPPPCPYTTLFRSALAAHHRCQRQGLAAGAGAEIDHLLAGLGRGEQGRESRALVLDLDGARSEEHTSELQSHLNLVCRLLLEKNKM